MNLPDKKALRDLHDFVKRSFLRSLPINLIKDIAKSPDLDEKKHRENIRDLMKMLGKGKNR